MEKALSFAEFQSISTIKNTNFESMALPQDLAKTIFTEALGSERTYFCLGAEVESGPGYVFAAMPGLERIPSACVCLISSDELEFRALANVIIKTENNFVHVGARRMRFYLDRLTPGLSRFFHSRGYEKRIELVHAFILDTLKLNLRSCASWRPILNETDWKKKETIHAAPSLASDGYVVSPREWLTLERRKALTGKIDFWTYSFDHKPVATAGTITLTPVITRIKNFFVGRDYRGLGIGKQSLEGLLFCLREAGVRTAIALSVEGTAGQRLYNTAGAVQIGRIYEWSREREEVPGK